MPRPDKRFIRDPGRGASESPTAGDASTSKTPVRRFVKGRHLATPGAADASPPVAGASSSALPPHSLPDERVSKYDRRASGASVPPRGTDPRLVEPGAASTLDDEATEVVVDLRENPTGFEAVYRRRPVGRLDDEDE